jgi:hypothetical protein
MDQTVVSGPHRPESNKQPILEPATANPTNEVSKALSSKANLSLTHPASLAKSHSLEL